jgi:outer membrane protein
MKRVWRVPVAPLAGANMLYAPSACATDANDKGSWLARLRAAYLDPANKSDAIPSPAVPIDATHVNSKVLPELESVRGATFRDLTGLRCS